MLLQELSGLKKTLNLEVEQLREVCVSVEQQGTWNIFILPVCD